MSTKKKRKVFVNGNYTTEEWVALAANTEAMDAYMRKFTTKIGGDKCPPQPLIPDGQCYFCRECQDEAKKAIKEYKNHYTVRGKKYLKKDMGE